MLIIYSIKAINTTHYSDIRVRDSTLTTAVEMLEIIELITCDSITLYIAVLRIAYREMLAARFGSPKYSDRMHQLRRIPTLRRAKRRSNGRYRYRSHAAF